MNVKDLITQDFLHFQQMHVLKDTEAKVTYHYIFGKIVLASQLGLLTLADANNLIDILFVLYDTLESRK